MLILAYDEDDNIVHIKDAEKGKSYKCPDCGAEVRPRKGTKKTHHFFHINAEDCGNSGESIVHKYYKEFIASQKTVNYNGLDMIVTNSKVEQTLPNLITNSHIIADVMLELGGYKWIAVEVCYKNHKDENHIDIYNALHMECFEVYVDMNVDQTDFEIKGYEKIASVEQYVNNIKKTIEEQHEKEVKEIVRNKDNEITKHKCTIMEMENDVVDRVGYYLRQITCTYVYNDRKHTFIQLMNDIKHIIRKYSSIHTIELYVKDYNAGGLGMYDFDINFYVNNEVVYTMNITDGNKGYYTNSYSIPFNCGTNAVECLYWALQNNYYFVTKRDWHGAYSQHTFKIKTYRPNWSGEERLMKRRNCIKINIKDNVTQLKEFVEW